MSRFPQKYNTAQLFSTLIIISCDTEWSNDDVIHFVRVYVYGIWSHVIHMATKAIKCFPFLNTQGIFADPQSLKLFSGRWPQTVGWWTRYVAAFADDSFIE